MNIAFITPRISGIGGAEKYVTEKIIWLNRKGYKCIVIAGNHTKEESPYLKILLKNKIKYYNLEWLNEPEHIQDNKKLEKYLSELNFILKKEKIELIETNQIVCGIYGYNYSVKYKIPICLNVLSELGFDEKNDYIELIKKFNEKHLYYNLGENSNKYIENKAKISLKNCKNIPIPITIEKNLLIEDKGYILTVSRFDKGKEYLFTLIEDYEKLYISENKNCPSKLIIIGDGIYRREIHEKVEKINKKRGKKIIELPGYVTGKKLEELYAGCSFYVGMGTTLLTAVAYGKNSIVATIEKEHQYYSIGYFKNDKKNGYSFGQSKPDSEFKSYYYYMKKLINNKYMADNLIEENLSFIENEFSLDAVMRKWEMEYKEILENFNDIFDEFYIPKYFSIITKLKLYLKKFRLIKKILYIKKGRI